MYTKEMHQSGAVGKRARVTVGPEGYTINGIKMRRTTGIIGGIPKPALARWKKANTVRETLKLAPGLANLGIEEAVKVVMGKRTEPSRAMQEGTWIHGCIEDAILGTPGRYHDKLNVPARKKARAGWAFVRRHMHRGVVPELTVFNPETKVSGTLDAWDPVTPAIYDWKTGKSLYDSHVLQIILYGRYMTRCVVPDPDHDPSSDHIDGTIQRWTPEKAGDMILVRLSDAGNALAKVVKEEAVRPALDVIRSLVTIMAWSERSTSDMWETFPRERKQ